MTDGPEKRWVAVAGATGYLGRYVVQRLHEAGFGVRALARDADRLGFARECADEVFIGEATQPETLAGLCEGAEIVISSLGIRAFRGRPTYWDVDLKANLNVVERARAAGARRFIFVSVLHGAETRRRVPQVEARERVVDALRQQGPRWTIIRPTGFFNDMVELLDMARRGTVWLIGDGKSRLNPIHGADLADFIVKTIDNSHDEEAELDVGGPESMSSREIGELAFEVLGKPARFRHVPPGVLRFLGAVTQPFSPNLSNGLKFFALAGSVDATAPPHGTHRLEDFYRSLVDAPTDGADMRIKR